MLAQIRSRIEWLRVTALTASQDVLVDVGNENSGVTYADCRDCSFLKAYLVANKACTLRIEQSEDETFPAGLFQTIDLVLAAAGSVTLYNLSGVYANNNGWLTLSAPFVRLRLLETSASVHGTTRLYAQAWG